MSQSNTNAGSAPLPVTYKINLPANSVWSGDVSSTGSGQTVWITNPYPYNTYWDITVGTGTVTSGPWQWPTPTFIGPPCGQIFHWDENKDDFICGNCGHSQKRHVRNHHGEEDHCRDCKTPEQKNILPDGKDGT